MGDNKSIAMIGATGAVGTACIDELVKDQRTDKLLLLGRRHFDKISSKAITQKTVDVTDPTTYDGVLEGYHSGICTLGIGEPSKVSKETFVRIDKDAVLLFARACKRAGVSHFQLLSSVGVDPKSRSFYLRTKGELVEELKKLEFDRLSIFQPSMIITPSNRYGLSQGVLLAVWPFVDKLFFGPLRKYKGVKVTNLGASIAKNTFLKGTGVEFLTFRDFVK